MRRVLCKLVGHTWTEWRPRHGRARYRERNCECCRRRQVHDVQLNQILEMPK